MPNYTPATATVIAALPYAVTQDVTAAPTGTGFQPSCMVRPQRQAVWWVFTPPLGTTAIGVTLTFDTGLYPDYVPSVSFWTGVGPTQVAQQCYLLNGAAVGYMSVNATPGVPLYIQIINDSSPSAPAVIDLTVERYPNVAAQAGSLVVSNDTPSFPTAVLSRVDGALLQIRGFAACEEGEWLPDGTLALVAETAAQFADAVEIYDSQLVFQRSIAGLVQSGASDVVSPLTSNGVDRFYCCERTGADCVVRRFLPDGTIQQTWTISPTNQGVTAISVNAAETILYISRLRVGGQALALARWDLINDVALADLVTPATNTYSTVGRDLPVLSDGSVLWPVKLVASPSTYRVLRYSAAGALLNTYVLQSTSGEATGEPRFRIDPTDPTTFWVMDWPQGTTTGLPERYRQFRVADGVVLTALSAPIKGATDNVLPPLFGPSQSCPLLINPVAMIASAGCQMTQLPLEAAYGYPLIQPIQSATATGWNTPASTPSRRGR